ncbi:isocitrate/isopropylmalate dehydrogenase family protein [Eubacteriales bacterium OttesenSCG-928-N14]|nr:isocitrate/isopropylmalate dehydrogenase family protein [Eubacteriales bacterium OttesenSCG-928-N14]
MKFNITVMPGDGIGPEIINETVRVLKAAQRIVTGFELDMQSYDAGVAHYLKTGTVLPDDVLKACEDSHAMLLGAIGQPNADTQVVRDERGTEVNGELVIRLRRHFQLYAGIRPIKYYEGITSPLKDPKGIDFVILRENTEGLYISYGGGIKLRDTLAVDSLVVTREASERLFEYGFSLAKERANKQMLTCVDKSNVLSSMALFRNVYDEVAQKHPSIQKDYAFVDAMALWMVQKPQYYDVVVTENSHGDILSDLGAALIGGMGMAPSGDVGENTGVFQPSHGTAPTIVGKNIANPIATILSGRMMLEFLHRKYCVIELKIAAELIENSVKAVLEQGVFTQELGGNTSTTGMADAIIAHMQQGQ